MRKCRTRNVMSVAGMSFVTKIKHNPHFPVERMHTTNQLTGIHVNLTTRYRKWYWQLKYNGLQEIVLRKPMVWRSRTGKGDQRLDTTNGWAPTDRLRNSGKPTITRNVFHTIAEGLQRSMAHHRRTNRLGVARWTRVGPDRVANHTQ